jgi:hypothetical protein
VNVSADFSELMEYVIFAAFRDFSTEKNASASQDLLEMERYAGLILNLPMRV